MKHREERRRFWSALVARFEESGRSRREFAADAGVGLAIFQYWLYKLRREREREARLVRKAAVPEVRLVPVTVKARRAAPARLEIRVAGVRLRVPVGADPGYVARLSAALREARAC
jgi:hypothetical protein